MRASELLQAIEDAMAAHGDLPVVTLGMDGWGYLLADSPRLLRVKDAPSCVADFEEVREDEHGVMPDEGFMAFTVKA